MSAGDEDGLAKKDDPMGVWRRWGKREFWYLIAVVLVVLGIALLARRHDLDRPSPGPPLGGAPGPGIPAARR